VPKSRPDTWMPFYIGDYMRDTSRLTTEAHGAYLLLIFDYWASGKPLPDDDQQLAAITRLAVSKWKALRSVIAPFFIVGDGLWKHKRVDHELATATEKMTKKSAAGRTGATARWAKEDGNSTANWMANASEPQWQTHSNGNGKRYAPSQGSEAPTSSTFLKQPSESVAAQENNLIEENPEVQRSALPAAAPKPREKIKEQLRSKLMRYCNAKLSGEERSAAIMGLMGEDDAHDAQWWLDTVDKQRKREGWDDTRKHGAVA
jgi:uncharacterized protein YdaU (DUF1376 family)